MKKRETLDAKGSFPMKCHSGASAGISGVVWLSFCKGNKKNIQAIQDMEFFRPFPNGASRGEVTC